MTQAASNVEPICPPAGANHLRLGPQQVQSFRTEGYLIHKKPVLSPSRFEGLRARFEQILDGLDANVRPESMDVPHFSFPDLIEWACSAEVLDLVEPILGPDIALFSTHFICKPRGNGKRVPWHEDSAYWKGMMEPMSVCTVWLAIDPSTRVNGCMKVIPRTHNTGHKGFSDYEGVDAARNLFNTEIIKPQRDDSRAVHIELAPNEASLHDARIIHGSDPNTSEVRRCGYTMRFMPTTSKFNDERFGDRHKIYLARGRDRAGNVYGDPRKAYPEIARFRSKTMANSH